MKKISALFILSFVTIISCLGQNNNDRIRFCKKMPHFSKAGMTWQIDTISYYRVYSEIDLYKSSDTEYPYLYRYEDDKKEIHYFFIREKDIKISKEKFEILKVEILMYDEGNLQLSIKKYMKDLIFSLKLN